MPFYTYRCPQHGDYDERKSMDHSCLDADLCPICGDYCQRVYTAPVINMKTFGKHIAAVTRPQHTWRPRSEADARQFRDAGRETGAVRQFGAGRSTGT